MELLTQTEIDMLPGDVCMALGGIHKYAGQPELSKQEQNAFNSFSSQRRKKEFAATRSVVRSLIGRMGLDAEGFSLQKDGLGKPFGIYGNRRINVSIAHTAEVVLCGISQEYPLGVDFEPVKREADPRLRKRILHEDEREALRNVELIRIWTIKEALVKLEGKGLRTNLNELIVAQESRNEFSARFNNDKSARICSFHYDQYWIALAQYR